MKQSDEKTPIKKEIRPQIGPQELFLSSSADIVIYGGAAGGGKLLALDTPIPTPYGWTSMGDLCDNDVIFSEKGTPIKVKKAHKIVDNSICYRLVFDDGSIVDAGEDHLWLTFTASDLSALTRHNPEWRSIRRDKRPSKINGNKSELFTKTITEKNKSRIKTEYNLPTGSVKTTKNIAETLKLPSGRANHAIPVTEPLQYLNRFYELDPYIFGVWLGDGTTVDGSITTADEEIVSAIQLAGYNPIKRPSSEYTYGTRGLRQALRKIGVLGNKHIPNDYLQGNHKQRLALLQGLMDTDGCVCESGSVEFTSTLQCLAEGIAELARSLGSKVRVTVGRATLYGKDCGPKYRVKWTASYPAFRLSRKLKLQKTDGLRRTLRFRYIISCDVIPTVPMRCITVDNPTGLYLCGKGMIPTHNTFGLLIDPLRHIKTVKGFGAVIFRRETPQITNEGGLLDESRPIYFSQGGVVRESPKIDWSFPPFNNRIHFDHLQYDKTVTGYDGAQICYIGFDQLEHFSQYQFFYMMSRNRSTCGIRPCIRATANPDAESWLADFIGWWINPDTGYPIEERGGIIRYFIRDGNQIVWSDSKEGLEQEYHRQPKSVTFIPAKLSDNPILEQINPEYRGNLQALSYVEQERLLKGNWKIKAEGGTVFKREWFEVVDRLYQFTKIVRYWDMAGTKKSKRGHDPDWTSGLKLGVKDGIYYVLDVARIRANPGETEEFREAITNQDGMNVRVREEQEPGSSGKKVVFLAARDQFRGMDYLGVPSSGSKLVRAVPASRAAYNGLIKVVRAPWNDIFFAELESFPDGKHDDIVDTLSGAFNDLAGNLRTPANEPTAEEAVVSGESGEEFDMDFFSDDDLMGIF